MVYGENGAREGEAASKQADAWRGVERHETYDGALTEAIKAAHRWSDEPLP